MGATIPNSKQENCKENIVQLISKVTSASHLPTFSSLIKHQLDASMSLPDRTTVLVVGAGPTGLACAISLIKQGVPDIIVVDTLLQGDNTSRALVIHAATLEVCHRYKHEFHSGFYNGTFQALDTVQCAEPLIDLGAKVKTMGIRGRERSTLVSIDFGSLAKYTRYPFGLLLPQNITERVLTEILESLGVKVLRPHTVAGMKTNEHDRCVVDVSFDDGQIISARYVVGADGARSTVRSVKPSTI